MRSVHLNLISSAKIKRLGEKYSYQLPGAAQWSAMEEDDKGKEEENSGPPTLQW